MADLKKLAKELSKLTVLEAAELTKMLFGSRSGGRSSRFGYGRG